MNPIVQIYAQLVKGGEKTIKQVPAHIRKQVQEEVDKENAGAADE